MKPPHSLALSWLAILAFAAPVHAAEPSEASPGSKTDAAPSSERLAELRGLVAHVLELSEAELIALVPKQSRGICWTTCPQCRNGDELFLGEAPSIRRIGGAHLREDESQLDRFQAPLLCWRRSGKALSSRFVAIHQPGSTEKPITSITRTNLSTGAFVLRMVRGETGTDYFFQSDTNAGRVAETPVPEGVLSFQGEHGWLRLEGGRVTEARLAGRGHLRLDQFAIEEDAGRFEGKVVASKERDDAGAGACFEVSETLPEAAHYSTIFLTFHDGTKHAYTITKVSSLGGSPGSRIAVPESLGFAAGPAGLEWRSYPRRTIGGTEISYILSTWKSHGAHP